MQLERGDSGSDAGKSWFADWGLLYVSFADSAGGPAGFIDNLYRTGKVREAVDSRRRYAAGPAHNDKEFSARLR